MSGGGHTLGVCNLCRGRVIWARMDSGKRMPVDPAPADDGTVAIARDVTGATVGRVLRKDEQPDTWEAVHMTHFATCPRYLQQQAEKAARKTAQQPEPQTPGAPTQPAGVTVLDDYRRRAQRPAPRHGGPSGRR